MADYDITDQALSGLTYFNGERPDPLEPRAYQVPTKAGPWLAWYAGGVWCAFGIMAALLFRDTTGAGQLVDVSPPEGLARFRTSTSPGITPRAASENESVRSTRACFRTPVRCKDGYTVLAAFSDASFARLARIMNRPDLATDPRFDTLAKRTSLDTAAALVDELEAWSSQFTAQEILAKVQSLPQGAPVVTGRVNTPLETFHQENCRARGALQRLSDPLYGEVVVQAPPWKISETPPRLKWLCRPIGHDNERIYLQYLGLARSKLRELQARRHLRAHGTNDISVATSISR